jgi:alanine-glyoxylate transaminase / serine-glyoxylate transaminase / serine-pyruvate transaminase
VKIPDGIDDLAVRRRLLKDWGIEIGGGLGPHKGRAWRIGLMGYGSRQSSVTLLLAALETCLRDLGVALPAGEATRAAAAACAEASR